MIYRAERSPDTDAWRVVTRTKEGLVVYHDKLTELKAVGMAYTMNQKYKDIINIAAQKFG